MKTALVVGGSPAGIQAALDLADSQGEVYLVERESALAPREMAGGAPDAVLKPLVPKLLAAVNHPNIHVLANTEIVRIDGTEGHVVATIRIRPKFVLEEKCTGCGRCERSCPVVIQDSRVALETGSTGSTRKAIGPVCRWAVPYTFAVEKSGTSPCRLACPGGINAHGYVALTAQGRFTEALQLIMEAIPFPGICGRVCNRPCESACNRREIDESVAICSLKRFVADEAWDRIQPATMGARNDSPGGVAIVGSGPAGLTAAWALAKMGHAVTVFESMPVAGGMLATCIPAFRLPRHIVQREIDYIARLGVDIRTSVTVGRDVSLEDLKQRGYEAIFLAVGAHRSRGLGIAGESLSGVVDCISLLKDVSLGRNSLPGKRVVVIGGGNAAIDAARTVARLGATSVRVIYRRSRVDMPANEEEVREAEKEGVEILPLVAPKRILGETRATGIECLRCEIQGCDTDGRGKTAAVLGSEFTLGADAIVLAIGQEVDTSLLPESLRPSHGAKVILADPYTSLTQMPGVFAGGDATVGAGTVIESIASGKRAAQSIDQYLRNRQLPVIETVNPTVASPDEPGLRRSAFARQAMPSIPQSERTRSFDEVELGFTREMALREAERCLNCSGCSECMRCVATCELGAIIHHERERNLDLEVGTVVFATELEAAMQASPVEPFVLGSALAARAMATLRQGIEPADRRGTARRAPTGRGDATFSPMRIVEFGFPLSHPDSKIISNGSRRVGVFLCECGGQISSVLDFEEARHFCRSLPGVATVRTVPYACSDTHKEAILANSESDRLALAIIASCACCSLEQICYACTHTKVRSKRGLIGDSRSRGTRFEFVNVREQCAFVHPDSPASATDKAKALIASALARCVDPESTGRVTFPVLPAAVVLGSGTGAVEAARRIAAQGFETHITSASEGGPLSCVDLDGGLVAVHAKSAPISIDGQVGSFEVHLSHDGKGESLRAGVVIIDGESLGETTADVLGRGLGIEPARDAGRSWFAAIPSTGILAPETIVPGVFYCPAASSAEHSRIFGAAAAARASVLLATGEFRASPVLASVLESRCRWCGECQKACAFSAISMTGHGSGSYRARVDYSRCRGCGNCAPRCNTQAISLSGGTTGMSARSLEAAVAALVR